MRETVDLDRVTRALRNHVKKSIEKQDRLPAVLDILPGVMSRCGDYSNTRRMATLIGTILLDANRRIVVPCCPDYSHDGNRYTFHGLQGGISLLAEKHISFLRNISTLLPGTEITFLYADHEADDAELLRVTGKTKDEFTSLVRSSIVATEQRVSSYGWTSCAMTDFMPDLVAEEERCYRWIAENPNFTQRIFSETVSRADMYLKISRTLTSSEMRERTMRTAAQYVAFGRFAAMRGCMISNHTTVNLAWYLQTDAAILHNPVCIY